MRCSGIPLDADAAAAVARRRRDAASAGVRRCSRRTWPLRRERLGRGDDRGAQRRGERRHERAPALALADVAQELRQDRDHPRRQPRDRAGRAPRDHRPERRRQVDAVQPDQRPLRAERAARSCSTASDIAGLQPFEINRRGLSRSFQVTNIFPRLTVFENLRCARAVVARLPLLVLAARSTACRRQRAHRGACSSRSTSTARRDVLAGVLTYAEQRALEIGITIAGGADVILLDEPTAGMSQSETDARGRADPRGHRRQDAAHGRARHGRGVRPGRPHRGAGLRRDHRHRHAGADARQPARAGGLSRLACRAAQRDARGRATCTPTTARATSCRASTSTSARARSSRLLGRNGVGRSTTVKAIMGQVRAARLDPFQGRGRSPACKPYEIAHLGLGYVPENRDIFPELTVRQNLHARPEGRAQKAAAGASTTCTRCSRASRSAPTRGRRAVGRRAADAHLCRTLMGDPDLIMIDEPTEGLAPKIVELVGELPRRRSPRRGVVGPAGRAEADDRARRSRSAST